MKLIKPSFEILTPARLDYNVGLNIIADIEKAARTCYQSEGKIEWDKDDEPVSGLKLVKKLLDRKHEAMLEFGPSITVKFICDRGVSHELVRHRLASFAQESTRYCNYSNDTNISFIIPSWLELEEDQNIKITVPSEDQAMIWLRSMSRAEIDYNRLIAKGWTPQQARTVLPNSLKTSINIKANIREWRHIFKLRCAKTAHPQMRELMIPLLTDFQNHIPILFDDLESIIGI